VGESAAAPRNASVLAVTPVSATILLSRVAAGDRAAFQALARQWSPLALRIAAKVLPDVAEAEDAAQAALLNVWRKAASFDAGRGTAESWFRRLVVNAALDRRRTLKPVQPIEAAFDAVSPEPDPGERAEAADEVARLRAAIARLNPRQRAAIALFYGEDSSTAEVAEAIGATPKAVEGLLARARADLARILTGMRTDT